MHILRWETVSKTRSRTGAGIILCVTFLCHTALAQQITVAAAADLQSAMQEIAANFQQTTGKQVKIVYGSSGNFFQQIENGAPFDVFFSANLDYARKLDATGLAEPGTYYEYAQGKIVLWVRNDSKIDLSPGLRALLDPAIKKIAIANPEHAPYGQAAVAAMQKERIYDGVKSKMVLGENISQTAAFVISGAADIGIIALSLASSPNMKSKGEYVEVPTADYPPIKQACVVLKSSKNKDGAREFVSYVRGSTGTEILKRYGFELPSK